MAQLPPKVQQIRQLHAELIVRVVKACFNVQLQQQLAPVLQEAENNGWKNLVVGIRKILKGNRETSVLKGLDEEDTIILTSILDGLQNPASLPNPQDKVTSNHAAPGLAALMHGAGRGDIDALRLIADMAEQLSTMGGDMGWLAGQVRNIIKGERDPNKLCQGMTPLGEKLMLDIIAELHKLDETSPLN